MGNDQLDYRTRDDEEFSSLFPDNEKPINIINVYLLKVIQLLVTNYAFKSNYFLS